jgi:hypothetical protein
MQICLNGYRRYFWYAVMLSMVWVGSYVTVAAPSVSFIVNVEYQGVLVNQVSDIEVSLAHSVKGTEVVFPQKPLLNYPINHGLIEILIPVDDTNIMHFDQPGLYLSLYIKELNEYISVPFPSASKALVSDLSDRTMQLGLGKGVSINYLTQAISFGGSPVSGSVYVPGTVNATKFYGNGRYITGVEGEGLADDSSLERYGSRLLSNRQALQSSDIGIDVVGVNNDGYVGVNTVPERGFDVLGRVMALTDSNRVGDFKYPLDAKKSFVAWDHVQGAFKFGYVSRNVSVLNQNAFSRSSVSIGNDIVNYGDNSVVLGGVGHTVSGNYAVVLGGKYHVVDDLARYSSVVGGDANVLKARNVLDIGGEDNLIFSKQSLAIGSKGNQLMSGRHQAVIGDNNIINGDHIYVIGGSNYIIDSKDVLAMGSAGGSILAPHSWVLNLTDTPLSSVHSNQIIWAAPKGISINTSNIGVDLSVSGALELTARGTYFYGDGSLLENVTLLDQFWVQPMNRDNVVSLVEDSNVVLGDVGFDFNRLNLESGVRFSYDQSTHAGTLIYKDDILQGYVKDGVTKNLLIQDINTMYQFSSVFEYITNTNSVDTVKLKVQDVDVGKSLLFNGQTWVIEHKPYWENYDQHMWYDRPVSLWSEVFGGRLTLRDSNSVIKNSITFSSDYNTKDNIELGYNSIQLGDYSLSFGNQAFSIKNNDVLMPMVAIKKGYVNFFSNFSVQHLNSVYIPTQSQFQNLVIDSPAVEGSNLRNSHLTFPFLQYHNNVLNIRSSKGNPIYFNHNGGPHSMITDKYEWMIGTDNSLTAMSNQVRVPMVFLATGNVVLNTGFKIGVFNPNQVMEKGLKFNSESIQLIPDREDDSVFISSAGFSMRGNKDRGVLTVVDDIEDTVVHIKSDTASVLSSFVLKSPLNKWVFNVTGSSFILGKDNQPVIEMATNKLNIYSPSSTYADINVGGVFNVTGNVPLNVMNSNTFIKVTGNALVLNAEDWIKLESGLKLTAVGVGIGSDTDPSVGFHVKGKAHIQDGVYLRLDKEARTDRIESKIIKSSVSGTSLSNLRVLGFNSAQGFNVSTSDSTLDDDAVEVLVSFDPHFSTINIQNNSEENTPMVPIGADTFTFASSHYDIAFNSDSKLEFKSNLLESGGEIASSVSVNGRVTVQKSESDNTLFTIVGSIKDMTAIPFPWKSVGDTQVVTDNIKVGIGQNNPQYHLDVDGNMYATQVMVQGVTFNSIETPGSSSLSVTAENNIDVNLLESSDFFSASLGALSFSKLDSNKFSAVINSSFCNSDTGVKFKVCDSGDSGDAMVRFKNTNVASSMVFGSHQILSLDSDFLDIGHNKPIYIMDGRVSILSGQLGLLAQSPKNTLDIEGSLVVGDSSQPVFENSMMVQGRVQVGSSADSLDQALNVKGSVRVGKTLDFLTKSNSNDSMFIQDSLYVHSQHSGTGGLYVSGNVEAKVVSVAYGVNLESSSSDFSVIKNGNLNIQSSSHFTADTSTVGLIVSNNVGIGVSNPIVPLHIAVSGSVKIESVNNVAQLEFNDSTVMLEQSGATLNIVMDTNGKVSLQVNKTGVDIGYTDTPPTHNVDVVALDVNGDMDAPGYSLGGYYFGHVPTGSIVMWSGWTNELPEGWKICDGGSNAENGTDKCDLRGQFIMGSATFDIDGATENMRDTWRDPTNIVGTTTHNSVEHNHIVEEVTHEHLPLNFAVEEGGSLKSNTFVTDIPKIAHSQFGYTYYTYTYPYGHKWLPYTANYDKSPIKSLFDYSVGGGGLSSYLSIHNGARIPGAVYLTYGIDTLSPLSYSYPTNTDHSHNVANAAHKHDVLEESNTAPTHNHTLGDKGHSHAEKPDALHEHGDKEENPKFYTLMFIYLEGVGNP